MSRYFQIGELFFFPQKNEVHREQEVIKVRPKTAELLTALLEANGKIVSKTDLLKGVWDDAIVEEYVVFQSITELRKIFDGASIIKTHPRKGYSIAATIKECVEETPIANPAVNSKANNRSNYTYTAILALLLLISTFIYTITNSESQESTGSIIVLPVKNHISDGDHSWLRYGGMDLLIKYLLPHMKLAVLQTEDVLDIVRRAGVDVEALDNDSISRIFEVSGAKLIIELSLSGSTRDYQLVYSLHQKTDTKRGALFSENAESLFADLNTLILDVTGIEQTNYDSDYHIDFANELVAKAMDQIQAKSYQKAATLLKAVLVNEPNNLTAYKLLSQILNNTGEFNEAEKVSAEGMQIATQNENELEMMRIMFWHALSITQQSKFDEALPLLRTAKQKAKIVNDLLFVANISRVTGKVYLAQKKFDAAKNEFTEALGAHQAIQCPFGRSNTLIDLGELAYQSNEFNKAENYFNEALKLAQERHLSNTIELAEHWLAQVKQLNEVVR